jgi:hypothetical protein
VKKHPFTYYKCLKSECGFEVCESCFTYFKT